MRTVTHIAAQTGSQDAARQMMHEFEAATLLYVNKLKISLTPGESAEDLDRLRNDARNLVSDWMASFKFT